MMETKKTLYRDTDNKMLGGVASGLAVYMGCDVTVMRLIFAFFLFVLQGSVLAYILAWTNKGPSSQGYGFSCGHVWM